MVGTAVRPARAAAYGRQKRVLDLVLTVLAAPFFAPLALLLALAIRLDSPGGVLFRQTRLGEGLRPFTIYKFRTMRPDADDHFHRQAVARWAAGPDALAEARGRPYYFKSEADPRVTRVGRVLRLTGLDELPQLLNVLRGEMSLVGPRPAIPYELEHYEPWYYRRFLVRPGITGLWQVNRHRAPTLRDAARLDIRYAERMSLLLDLRILAGTARLVLRRGLRF